VKIDANLEILSTDRLNTMYWWM